MNKQRKKNSAKRVPWSAVPDAPQDFGHVWHIGHVRHIGHVGRVGHFWYSSDVVESWVIVLYGATSQKENFNLPQKSRSLNLINFVDVGLAAIEEFKVLLLTT